MNKKINLIFLIISLVCFAGVALSLFGMYYIETSVDEPLSKFSLVCGLCFWLSGISGIILQIIVSKNVRTWYNNLKPISPRFKKSRIGILNLFSNFAAAVSDIILCVSLILFISFVFIDSSGIYAYIFLAVLFLSFCAHCVFNGKNYYYITNYEYVMTQLTKMEEKVNEIN